MLPRNAPRWLDRLSTWLSPFEDCFGHVAQRGAFHRYLCGLLSDSRRKSMSAMLARVSDPGTYQAFQHFITHAPWDSARVWRRLLEVVPERRGVVILDDTGFPKQGTHSVGVARQYSGTLGKIANCQIAVTAALWTGARAWLLGAELYLPDTWLMPERRAQARIPRGRPFQEKWRLAVTLLRRVRAAGLQIDLVAADAGYGDAQPFRTALDRLGLAYVVGVSSTLTFWPGMPPLAAPRAYPRGGRPRTRARIAGPPSLSAAAWAAAQPGRAWRRVTWRNATHRPWTAQFLAVRVTPVVLWRRKQPLVPVWLLCQRPREAMAPGPQDKYYVSNLPATTSLQALVRAAHQRWAIEQQYQELKDELGLDHFEGRTFAGWHRHVVLTALAYAWLQHERHRRGLRLPTLPIARAVMTEILTAHFFVTHPHYLDTMLKLREINLRI
ncbi:MAG TPA: IS701 family transposase [Gemmatimonadales bacterium]